MMELNMITGGKAMTSEERRTSQMDSRIIHQLWTLKVDKFPFLLSISSCQTQGLNV
jgi:hypothetical protein